MDKKFLSLAQFINMAALFVFGSSVVMGVNTDAGRDSWFALLLGCVIILPLLFLYARLLKLHPEKNIFQMLISVFGKIAGKIFVAIFMFYCLHLAALVMRNFSIFIKIVAMPETPEILVLILLSLPVLYIAKSSIKTLGKWSIVSCTIVICILVLTIFLSFNIFKLDNLLPALDTDIDKVLYSGIKIAALPLGEIVMFLGITDVIAKKTSPYKAFIVGAALSGILLLLVVFRNSLTLGPMMGKVYFPSYTQAKIIHVSDSFERIEGLISFNFILAGITKITVCTISLAKGFAALFESETYQDYAFPSSYLILTVSLILYKNVMQMFEFIAVYHYYSVVFQFGIPILLWAVSEVRALVLRKNNPTPQKNLRVPSGSADANP